MGFWVSSLGGPLRNLLDVLRSNTTRTHLIGNLFTQINARKWNSIDSEQLKHTSNLPNASMKNKENVFSLHLLHIPSVITSLWHIPIRLNYSISYNFLPDICIYETSQLLT